MKTPKKHDYEVGYGKPPKHTRFKPGQSGNPSGRPKGVANLRTDVEKVLGQEITVLEGGRSVKLQAQELLVRAIVNRGLKGNHQAALKALELRERLSPDQAADAAPTVTLTASQRALLENVLRDFEDDDVDG
jgi:hypothetical protein